MVSKRWRERLSYAAMSAFVGWHTLAIMVAPAPDNGAIVQALRPLLQPYLSLLYLDNRWDFFAPGIERGRQFRYVIEDAAGKRRTVLPADDLNWYHPDFWWFTSWYVAIMDAPETHGDRAVAWFCRKYASSHPKSVTLLAIQQDDFSRDDYRDGKNPMDAEFITEKTLATGQCHQ